MSGGLLSPLRYGSYDVPNHEPYIPRKPHRYCDTINKYLCANDYKGLESFLNNNDIIFQSRLDKMLGVWENAIKILRYIGDKGIVQTRSVFILLDNERIQRAFKSLKLDVWRILEELSVVDNKKMNVDWFKSLMRKDRLRKLITPHVISTLNCLSIIQTNARELFIPLIMDVLNESGNSLYEAAKQHYPDLLPFIEGIVQQLYEKPCEEP